ncbi:MAG: DNA cytosine methyltransferase [Chloroflexota bacterium]
MHKIQQPGQTLSGADFFCGGGGSTCGMIQVPDVSISIAINHWQQAIETHQHNHPQTKHVITDLQNTHPSTVPKTVFAWFSPECVNHSNAKGRRRIGLDQKSLWDDGSNDSAAERSRATMREVVEFSAYHRYQFVIVENVSEIRYWAHYNSWLTAMHNLGYNHQEIYLNSMFALPVPQSRDRIYVCFWRANNKAPDLNITPRAWCPRCECDVHAQWWAKSNPLPGRVRYRKSYIYICPKCAHSGYRDGTQIEVHPYRYAAYNAIDWTQRTEPIGNRKRPLSVKTMERIQRGINKFKNTSYILEQNKEKPEGPHRIIPLEDNFVANHNRVPAAFISGYWSSTNTNKGIHQPLSTMVASGSHHSLVLPGGFLNGMWRGNPNRDLSQPISTITTSGHHALVMPFISTYYNNGGLKDVTEPLPTATTKDRHGLIQPTISWEIRDCGFRMLQPNEIKLAMGFPPDYTILGSKSDQIRQAGNAVTPPVAKLLLERMIKTLD